MEQKPRKTDRRTLYTKGVIKDAFLAALKTKSYDRITVSDLCKVAEINRSTFYLHYADALAVFDEILDELLDGITDKIDAVHQNLVSPYRSFSHLLAELFSLFSPLNFLTELSLFQPLFSTQFPH